MHAQSYADVIERLPGAELAGVAEADEKRGREFAQRHHIRWFADYHKLLEEDVDAAVVCSANVRHKDMAVAAAQAGKHILVEKPIATTVDDAQAIIDAAKTHGVKLMVAFPVRYAPAVVRARELIRSGGIGDVVAIAGTNHGTMPGGWFVDKALSGGGAVMDHTVHVADLMHWMLGSEIKNVYCKMGTKIFDIPVEDCALISLEFENGTYATLDASWNRPQAYPTWGDVTMEIIGTKGTLNLDAFGQHGSLYSNRLQTSRFTPWGDDTDELMIADFIRCIEENTPSPVSGEDGLFALRVALMAYRSAACDDVVTGL